MLGGGARGTQHFTEFVGGDVHITINWNTAQSLIETDGPVISRIDAQPPKDILDELSAKLPDFRKAFYEDALPVEEFKDFGPVEFFRSIFINGYTILLKEIAIRRCVKNCAFA
jgi:transaldolase